MKWLDDVERALIWDLESFMSFMSDPIAHLLGLIDSYLACLIPSIGNADLWNANKVFLKYGAL
jgi:hypothetical protein